MHQIKKATKHDADKLPWDLLPISATEGMLRVLAKGAKKYAPHNWRKGFLYSRLVAACFRHLAEIGKGHDNDPEWGLPHIDHLMCEVAFFSEHQKEGYGYDDRYKYKTTKATDRKSPSKKEKKAKGKSPKKSNKVHSPRVRASKARSPKP